MQEAELIQGLQNREEEAFKTLVALYKDRLYNTTLGFVQNESDAEDVTQEVFISVYQNMGQFKGEASLATWLYRVAVNRSLDFVRKKKRRQRSGLFGSFFRKEGDAWEEPDFYHPGVAAEQKEMAALLFKAIRQLPEQQQTAFLLQKMENLGAAQIAGVMNISVGAVESLLQRAKANLRKLLEGHYSKYKE